MFIYLQKLNLISKFSSEILWIHCKLAILETLGMLHHPHQKSVSICDKLSRLSAGRKSTLSFTFSLRYYKDTGNLLFWVLWTVFLEMLQGCVTLFWVLWACLATHTKLIVSTCRKLRCYLHVRNKLHHSLLSWDITF